MSKWSKKRRLFLAELLVFDALLTAGIILQFIGSGFGRALAIAAGMLAAMLVHIVLRLTYFKEVLAEVRKQRQPRKSTG